MYVRQFSRLISELCVLATIAILPAQAQEPTLDQIVVTGYDATAPLDSGAARLAIAPEVCFKIMNTPEAVTVAAVSALVDVTAFGYYTPGDPNSKVALWYPSVVGMSASLAATPMPFGLYIETPYNTFFSEAALNNDLSPHAIVYQGSEANTYWIGFEDLPFNGVAGDGSAHPFGVSDGDFQDLVVKLTGVMCVPEPGAFLYPALVVIGGGLLRRRARSRRA